MVFSESVVGFGWCHPGCVVRMIVMLAVNSRVIRASVSAWLGFGQAGCECMGW
jgi:aerobic-type carbon monoxide dehydrogenase small subunit (CoxS/CutS family)